MTSLLRARMVIVAAAMGVLAVLAGGIFDRWVWSLGIAVVVPAAVSIAVRPLSGFARLLTAVSTIAVSLAMVVLVEGGQLGDIVDALTSGAQRLLSTEWPSPDRPDLIGSVALLLGISSALATDIAGRRRWHLLDHLAVLQVS